MLKNVYIYDGINVTLSLKVGGHYSFDASPIQHKNLKLEYRNIPKTLEELFDFDTNIYRYYNSILKYNLYKIEQGWKKNYSTIEIKNANVNKNAENAKRNSERDNCEKLISSLSNTFF